MYDNLTMSLNLPSSSPMVKNIYAHLSQLNLIPSINKQGEIYKDTFSIDNLRLEYFSHQQRLEITNSIHKYLLGNNYSDFSLSQCKEAVQMLSDTLKIDLSDAEVKKLEVGCNISPDCGATVMYKSLISHKDKPFLPMVWNGKEYGASCTHSLYNIKFYDKEQQTLIADGKLLNKKLLRYELRIKRRAYLLHRQKSIPIQKAKDLWKKEHAQMLVEDLLRIYDATVKREQLDLSALTLREQTAIARVTHPDLNSVLQQLHKRTYREDKRLYKNLLEKNTGRAQTLRRLLEEQCLNLIES